MKFVYNDGGHKDAGWKGNAGDCATRALAIVTKRPYQEIYDQINLLGKFERTGKRKKGKSTARNGVYKATFKKLAKELGLEWTPTMFIGQGCKVHLDADELPKGRLVVAVSRHWTAVIDGVIHDTYDPSRGGRRCVYGYFK
jgi:hypothetical protein